MKRNQFLLTVIRLLVNTVFFYVLGTMFASYVENDNLLINTDEALVCSHLDNNYLVATDKESILFITPSTYTYVKERETAVHVMNATWNNNKYYSSTKSIECSIDLRARVNNKELGRPPRSDTIINNTS